MTALRIAECDIIYLSYDEPNAEKNYADLCSKIPWAKRVDGVKGSDAAHKACAEISDTDRFITIDGDNIINADLIQEEINLSTQQQQGNYVISWAANNQINGLIYGNGGVKLWPKNYVLNMKTHENAGDNPHAQVDFCWDASYLQIDKIFSEIHNNASAKQAWRAGFREGVKMCLDQGVKPDTTNGFFKNHWRNVHRAYIWMSVGADAKNGLWAIYGARQGFYKTMLTNWDYIQVRDFEYLDELWDSTDVTEDSLYEGTVQLGKDIVKGIDIPIPVKPLEPDASRFYKFTYQSPTRRTILQDTE